MMNHLSKTVFAIVVLAACDRAPPAPPATAAKEAPPTSVTMSPEALKAAGVQTAPVTMSKLALVDEMPGTIEAPSDALVILNAPASGVIDKLEADVGDRVAAGKRLATLKSSELAQAQADRQRSLAAQQLASSTLKRSEALFADGLISTRRLEADRAQERAAQLDIDEASQRIKILGGAADESSGTISIVSSIAGTVATRNANRGEAVAVNAPLFTVVDISRVIVQLRAQGGISVDVGAEVSFVVEGIPGRDFTAIVKSTSDILDPETRRFFIRCTLDNKDQALKPGMFVTARVPRAAQSTIVVPESALLDMDGGTVVFVALADGKFERRSVVAGDRADGQVAIASGLKDQDVVVTKGAFWVRSQLQRSELEEE